VVFDLRQRGQRADLETLRPGFYPPRQQRLDVDQALRGGEVRLDQRQQVRAAG
jgi:hypothetical protein